MAETYGNKKLRVASLFCGCGGMDLGIQGDFSYLEKYFGSLPFEVVYAADNDLYATNIYNSNFSHKCELKDSIIAQNPQRLGYKDEKGKLFFEMVNVLKEKQPRFFIGENVKGLLSANNGKAFPMIIKEFEKAGYHIHHKLLNASEFGVPQKRERIFIVGFREFDDYFNFRFPLPNTLNSSKVKLKQVIDKKANKDDKWFFSQRAVDGMLRVREKMNKGRVQDLEQPCNTISSHLAKVSLNGTDPVLMVDERYRRLTPREAARIQSFPESFKLDTVSENRQYRAIGNAVPPVLMWHVANALTKAVELYKPIQKKTKKQLLQEI
jgi:DNA (cytosine-5)-methyltransferase 1